MYGNRTTRRNERHLTPEELVRLREKWPWVADPVDSLPLDTRAFNCLRNAGILYLGELVQYTESELLRIKNFGRGSLKLLRNILADRCLMLNSRLSEDSSERLVMSGGTMARNVRHITLEELVRLREVSPWVTDPIDSLPLDVRTYNCLRNGGIGYLGELVQLTEWELLKLKNVGDRCLEVVKSVLAERGLSLGTQLGDDYFELLLLPRDALESFPEPPVVIPAPRNPTEELLLAGVLPSTPWLECLDVKVGTAHVLLEKGIDHVGDVIEGVRNGTLSTATMSPEWFEDLTAALRKVGVGRVRSGPLVVAALPQSLPAVCELALAHIHERQAAVFVRNYLFGESLEEIAEEWFITRSRVYQLQTRGLNRILRPLKHCIRERTRALAEALENEGILPREKVYELARCRDMRYILLALAISGRGRVRVSRDGALHRVGKGTPT